MRTPRAEAQVRTCVNPHCGRTFSVESERSPQMYCLTACRFWTGRRARLPARHVRDTGRPFNADRHA